jgi:hypothetical protein
MSALGIAKTDTTTSNTRAKTDKRATIHEQTGKRDDPRRARGVAGGSHLCARGDVVPELLQLLRLAQAPRPALSRRGTARNSNSTKPLHSRQPWEDAFNRDNIWQLTDTGFRRSSS